MPRPKRPGAPEPKRRSRKGCWPCKARKVKCGEEKPYCLNCQRQGEACDYSIRLNWEGRTKRKSAELQPYNRSPGVLSFENQSPTQFQMFSAFPGSPAPSAVSSQYSQNASRTRAATFGSRDMNDANSFSPPARQPSVTTDCWTEHNTPPTELWRTGIVESQPAVLPNSHAVYDHPFTIDFHSTDSDPLLALNIGGNFVSQSTSFLRQSLGALPDTPASPSFGEDGGAGGVAKRMRLSSYPFPSPTGYDTNQNGSLIDSPASAGERSLCYGTNSDTHSTGPRQQSTPLSPTSPLVVCNEIYADGDQSFSSLDSSIALRRVSIHSLLSHSAGLEAETETIPRTPGPSFKWEVRSSGTSDNYGFDYGHPDLDLNKNDDSIAIKNVFDTGLDELYDANIDMQSPRTISLAEKANTEIEGDYYKQPVPVNIPRYLSPLPSTLLENPMNLMYFHHFLHHTARVLVPHHCPENPFVSLLPSVAVTDPNLLNLLLAYSASHRARYLQHPEPANRIAHWVSDVFPALRRALNDPQENITNSHLATAIMLLSLKIVSPSTFEVPIPWQSHLKLARDLFLAREEHQPAHAGNKIGIFLARWLAYLEIFGALSCRHSDPPLLGRQHWSFPSPGSPANEGEEFQVDCFLGFTPRTKSFLTRLGELTHRCDNERFDEMGAFRTDWKPSPETIFTAENLLHDMKESQDHEIIHGAHHDDAENVGTIAIDRAFYWSAIVHLHRRVLGTPTSAPQLRECLSELFSVLRKIPTGSSPEMSAIFPMFTAGCETPNPAERLEILDRIKGMEVAGLKQVQNARTLMQRCWQEDLPWIALAEGEFLA